MQTQWGYERLLDRAEDLASRPFAPAQDLPAALNRLDYDRYRLIAFRHEKAVWRDKGLPFWLECFHRGYLYRTRVNLNLVEDGVSSRLAFDPELFQYRGELSDLEVPSDLGFAGFRVLGRFRKSAHPLEIASFLGASYFRAIGENQRYGTSARGLAVNIGLSEPEEFPVFREFWVQRPVTDDRQLYFWALLDSPSVVGAYAFTLAPGEQTRFDVSARLFFRHKPKKIGLAPLTSMWMWGDGRKGPSNDPRPEVHDSDGLLVRGDDDRWIWRPLVRMKYPSLSHFDFKGIHGFGLMQRDRDPAHYRDDEARYHLRPSVWIEPRGSWPKGAVELLELPADHEGIDNIAAWWTPAASIDMQKPVDLAYTVSFMSGQPDEHSVAQAIRTNVDRLEQQSIHLAVVFEGRTLKDRPIDSLMPVVRCQRGKVGNAELRSPANGKVVLSFDARPDGESALELSAVLTDGEEHLTEMWRYLCPTSHE